MKILILSIMMFSLNVMASNEEVRTISTSIHTCYQNLDDAIETGKKILQLNAIAECQNEYQELEEISNFRIKKFSSGCSGRIIIADFKCTSN